METRLANHALWRLDYFQVRYLCGDGAGVEGELAVARVAAEKAADAVVERQALRVAAADAAAAARAVPAVRAVELAAAQAAEGQVY